MKLWNILVIIVLVAFVCVAMSRLYPELSNTMSILGLTLSISLSLALLVFPWNNDEGRNSNSMQSRSSSFLTALASNEGELPSMRALLQSLENDSQLKQEHTKILLTLKNEIRSGKIEYDPVSLVHRGIIITLVEALRGVAVDDLRMALTFELVNEILNNKAARVWIFNDERRFHEVVDAVVVAVHEWISVPMKLVDDALDTAKIKELEESAAADVSEWSIYQSEEERLKERSNLSKRQVKGQCHKALITLGLLASESKSVQSLLCDRGVMRVVLDCLQLNNTSVLMSKWCLWTLIHLIFEHPPNKREFFQSHGISTTLAALKTHRDVLDVNQQAFGLLFCILRDDPYAKIKLHSARTQALAHGIIDASIYAQKRFAANEDVVNTIQAIQQQIYNDWS